MVFSSIPFLFFFLPAVLLVYYLAPRKARNLVLLLFSLVFYAWGEPIYIGLMVLSIVANYFFGLFVDRAQKKDQPGLARRWLIGSVVFNVLLLGFFKYADFLLANLASLFHFNVQPLGIPLPIGISFYTFQIMSYVIDLYWGRVWVQTSIIDLGTYLALFPQLIAGPIVRIRDVAEALRSRLETSAQFAEGVSRFLTGLAKKVLLANTVGRVWDQVQGLPVGNLSVASAWIGILAFAFQIYFDFSAYSDMAIGLGLLFGFRFNENFDYPYMADSVTDFWRRWHISLSSWFREYVYIPLGGNRKGLPRQILNIFIVWAITGLWHGANWNFVLWGVYFSVWLSLEKLFLLNWLDRLPRFLRRIYALLVVLVSWVIFSFTSLVEIKNYLQAMFGLAGQPFLDGRARYDWGSNALLFIILILAATPWPRQLAEKLWTRSLLSAHKRVQIAATSLRLAAGIVLFLLVTAHLVDAAFNPFLYFRF